MFLKVLNLKHLSGLTNRAKCIKSAAHAYISFTKLLRAHLQIASWWYSTKTSPAYLESETQSYGGRGGGGDSGGSKSSNHFSNEIAQFAAASMFDEVRVVCVFICLLKSTSSVFQF